MQEVPCDPAAVGVAVDFVCDADDVADVLETTYSVEDAGAAAYAQKYFSICISV